MKHKRRARPSRPRGWLTWAIAALLVCIVAAGGAALAGVYSLPSLASLFPDSAPTASPAPQVVVVVTSTPVPTETPDPDAPRVTNIRFCSKPCDRSTAIDMPSYPENVTYIYISMDFSGMKPGMKYTREWRNRGELWVHYDCEWQGEASMRRDITLRDINGGLRAGMWEMTITIDGKPAATASTIVNGGNQNWDPFNPVTQPCPDWK